MRQRFEKVLALVLVGLVGLAGAGGAWAQEGGRWKPEYRETKELIALVEDAGELIAEVGLEEACRRFRQPRSRWFDEQFYVFVIGMEGEAEGETLCHPAQPALEGTSTLELRDPAGKPIIRSFLRELASGDDDGWVHYLWPRPGESTFVWKTAYVRRAHGPEGREYLVGSGLYQMKMERFFVVEQVEDAVDLIETLGEMAFDELRDEAGSFRFYDAYVFVMNEEGVHLVNAEFPQYEGRNMLDVKDADGKVIGREMLDLLAHQEAGWVDYLWPKPGDTRPSKKSSYVHRAELDGQMLVVGAGVYLDP